MNNKNIFKYLIIIAIVVLVIVATVLIILNTKVKNPNIQEDVGEEDLPELEIDESIEKIDQINTFSMVEKIVNSNIDSNTTFFATEIYFQEIDVVLAYRLYVFGEIFDIVNQSYQNVFFAIDFDEESSNYKITQKKLDIEQSEYEQIAKSGAQKYLITDNYNGEFLQEDISDNLVVKRYFDYYKMLMITNPEKAYSLLDDEYKKIKFENYNNFYTYINNKIAQIKAMELSKLQVNYFDDEKQYVAYSNYSDYYIFQVKDVMDFSVLLDQYLVDIPQFVTKYEASDIRIKTALNINKFIMGINDKNYAYVYTLLADSFKNNIGVTDVNSLEKYLKENFYENNEIEFLIFEEQGSYYTYSATLKDKNSSVNKEIKFVMKLEDGTNFKMSFSF